MTISFFISSNFFESAGILALIGLGYSYVKKVISIISGQYFKDELLNAMTEGFRSAVANTSDQIEKDSKQEF